MDYFKNKKIWITGASSGIGSALAHTLCPIAQVAVSGRNLEGLEDLSKAGAKTFTLDLQSDLAIKQVIPQIVQALGGLDIIILNAGNCYYVDVDEINLEETKALIQLNYLSLVSCIKYSLPYLKKSKMPQIIGISSAVIMLPLTRSESYGASKAAMNYYLESLRTDVAPYGIDISIVYPGFVQTPLTDKNDFPMPFLVSSNYAAQVIIKGIRRKKPYIYFPWRLIGVMYLISKLPFKIRSYCLNSLRK